MLEASGKNGGQIGGAAPGSMEPIEVIGGRLGINSDEMVPFGRYVGKVDYERVLGRLGGGKKNRAKIIDVTGITPTRFGEGKTTAVIGLLDGLWRLGKRTTAAIRQPSSGPTFNIKGSGVGGGLAQCVPSSELSVRFTGDIDCITNAHNLAMVALTARMQHERNYDDDVLAGRGLKRLNIDSGRVQMKWVMDFCAQALRKITIGNGGKMSGVPMESGFAISASSELMSILAVTSDLRDIRNRIGKIVVACDKNGGEVTTSDLEVDGAMSAWMLDTIKPNLAQTMENRPVFVHAGPFANIGIGQSSVIADRLGAQLGDYHITESGFGSDIGYEKFWNLKCRISGLRPAAVVIVATIRALKMHGGGPAVRPGRNLSREYLEENIGLVEKGCENLAAHIDIVKKSGVTPVVCINAFETDTKREVETVRKFAEAHGALAAYSEHWAKGGGGAQELAEAVVAACEEDDSKFAFLYGVKVPLGERIRRIATEIYGADGVEYVGRAGEKLQELEAESDLKGYGTCVLKTHLSLSHDAGIKGRPRDWRLPVTDFLIYRGARLVVPVASNVELMPGTGSDPAFRRIDIDVDKGGIIGIS